MHYLNSLITRLVVCNIKSKKLIFKKNDVVEGSEIGSIPSYDTNIFISIYSSNKNVLAPFKNYINPINDNLFLPETNCRFRFIFKTTKVNICSFRAYTCHDKIALLSNVDNLEDYIIDGEKQKNVYLRWKMDFSKLPKNFELIITDSRTNQYLQEITYTITDNGFIKSIDGVGVDDHDYILYHLYDKEEYWGNNQ